MTTTWDGVAVSSDPPFGASVVVYRRAGRSVEYLLLHRAHSGPQFEGDWAWTPPSGARQPSEDNVECARRELIEETGLCLDITRTNAGDANWVVFTAEASADAKITLDEEHDRYDWLTLDDALARTAPSRPQMFFRRATHEIAF
ncbi:MAG TPA: NUDIX domain-containing protein [Solirubrobacteraceae bacterium]|nr:NUDIX domain-containing protein [Solirubrobacteraceae bacterium]